MQVSLYGEAGPRTDSVSDLMTDSTLYYKSPRLDAFNIDHHTDLTVLFKFVSLRLYSGMLHG